MYRNLPPGKYSFKISASSAPGHWGSPLSYAFTIRPPWWLTWWAYTGYFLLFCGLAYLFFLFIKARLQLQNQLAFEQSEARRLKELDTFKTRLYTNLTHEFRTPLTVILGMAAQIRDAPKKNLDKAVVLIERNGKNLLRLINQLLDLSKLENNALQLQLQRGDLVTYLRYLTESFKTYANGRNLALRFSSVLEGQEMDYDPEQIKQIMSNLISNAVKFTPPGGSIEVKLSKQGQDFIIKIADTGLGIEKKNLPYIFDRFYQTDDSSTRKNEGTGIGLAHTRELVQLMNGRIEVESLEDQGTTFTILLPISTNSPNGARLPAALVPDMVNLPEIVEERPTDEIEKTINPELPQLLIIEDNYDVVVYLKACLDDRYQIRIAYNGKVGIEQALQYIPDLVICDVMMPEKNGFEVCECLKNDERTSHIPIILLTAKADVPSRIKGLHRGADAYLLKPFHKEELLVRLQMLKEKQERLTAYFQRKWQEVSADSVIPAASVHEAAEIENAFLQKLTDIMEANYENEQFGLRELCGEVSMSRSQLFRKMKALYRLAPSEFIRSFRLRKAKYLLETTDLNVSEVTWKTGFSNPTHFSRIFKEEFGISPSDFNK